MRVELAAVINYPYVEWVDTNTTPKFCGNSILLFDGVCNTCNAVVNFLLEHDEKKQFLFASLQSEAGRALARKHDVDADLLETVVLIHEGRAYLRSDAVIKVLELLGGAYKFLAVFKILPLSIRDSFYRGFATNRYRIFGRKDTCRVPSPEERSRFLD